jgi:hypothetical protein
MDDVSKLEALRQWTIGDESARRYEHHSAARAYEQMRSYLLAQLERGRITSVGALRSFATKLTAAIRSDIRRSAYKQDGPAILAFWTNALGFLGEGAAAARERQ